MWRDGPAEVSVMGILRLEDGAIVVEDVRDVAGDDEERIWWQSNRKRKRHVPVPA